MNRRIEEENKKMRKEVEQKQKKEGNKKIIKTEQGNLVAKRVRVRQNVRLQTIQTENA